MTGFKRDLGDEWMVEEGMAWDRPCVNLCQRGVVLVFAQYGDVIDMETGVAVPARVMLAFLNAYREWSLQQPEGSPDRVEWEAARRREESEGT